LDLLPPPTIINKEECIVHRDFSKNLQKPMGELADAFLYLGLRISGSTSKCPPILRWSGLRFTAALTDRT
jgi:hypothetical protein